MLLPAVRLERGGPGHDRADADDQAADHSQQRMKPARAGTAVSQSLRVQSRIENFFGQRRLHITITGGRLMLTAPPHAGTSVNTARPLPARPGAGTSIA